MAASFKARGVPVLAPVETFEQTVGQTNPQQRRHGIGAHPGSIMIRTAKSSNVDPARRALMLGAAGASLAHIAGCGGGGSSGGMGASGSAMSASPPLTDTVVSSSAEQSLPIIPLDDGVVDATGVRTFALSAQTGTTQFRKGVNSGTLGYNGALLGPALKLRTGERTRIRVQNNMAEVTTVHWHGLMIPADMDGGPHQAIAPGGQWQASFAVSNPASTCWFHPHTHASTGRQVVMGLAGLLIVEDPAQTESDVPGTWGVDDIAVVLQDKRFTASGQINYALTPGDGQLGYLGDVLLANGAMGAVCQAPQQWVRLRLLNGCNARFLTLRLGNSAPLLQIANEGGLLAAPVARLAISLAPGERAEVLVDFSTVGGGQDVSLLAATVASGMGMGMGMGMGGGTGMAEVSALKFRVSLPRQPGAILRPPDTLAGAPTVVAGAGATIRTFNLGAGMMGGPFTINGRAFDMNRVDLVVPANTVEIWKFTNATGMAHPMHVHGVRMSLLARDGLAPAAHERGLRDTFVVESMQTVTVAVETAAQASSVPLMYHCHILEHEDAGMMGQFITV
ncbi:MAG: multicopper oxidase domain-containing protein [Rubrivivax sp.]|nr:multicopper oxidase domain-containing protein [Rubrivivax sp.]